MTEHQSLAGANNHIDKSGAKRRGDRWSQLGGD
jgi:hypothetical protein